MFTNVSLKSLRDKISLVSQDVILFDDSVENNIKYDQQSENALKVYKKNFDGKVIYQKAVDSLRKLR